MKWISVTDLPPEGTDVLIYNPDDNYWPKYFVGHYKSGKWYGGYNCFLLSGVTHWAKINPPTKSLKAVANGNG